MGLLWFACFHSGTRALKHHASSSFFPPIRLKLDCLQCVNSTLQKNTQCVSRFSSHRSFQILLKNGISIHYHWDTICIGHINCYLSIISRCCYIFPESMGTSPTQLFFTCVEIPIIPIEIPIVFGFNHIWLVVSTP